MIVKLPMRSHSYHDVGFRGAHDTYLCKRQFRHFMGPLKNALSFVLHISDEYRRPSRGWRKVKIVSASKLVVDGNVIINDTSYVLDGYLVKYIASAFHVDGLLNNTFYFRITEK